MKPQVFKADVGCIVKFTGDEDIYYVGELVGDGNCYQSKQAFRDNQGICYIDRYGWFDEVGWDENVSDEMYDWMARHPKYSGVTFGGTAYTRNDLEDVVGHWIDDCYALNDIDDDAYNEFVDYFAGVLFANLVNGRPEDKILDYDPYEEYQLWLKTYDDPRLTPQQRKELGYE